MREPVAEIERDTHLLYSSKPPGFATAQIFRKRVDGTDVVQLTADQTVEHHWPRPSPDGRLVLFYRAAPGKGVNDVDTNSLWVMNSDGSDQRLLIPHGTHGWTRQGHVEWSPDGTRLLMSAGGATTMDLFLTDPDGGNLERLTDRGSSAIDPSWSPDGRRVLFITCPTPRSICSWWQFEVFLLDLDTGVERRLTFDGVADFDPYFSPDGSTIVWLRCTGLFPFGPWSIYRANAEEFPLEPVPVVDDGHVNSNVDFSSDGETLVFSRHEIGGSTTWMSTARVGVDGSGLSFIGGAPAPVSEWSVVFWP